MKKNLHKMSLRLILVLLLPINVLLAQTWQTPMQLGSNYLGANITSVYFTSATQGWAVGNGGTILVTSNGGTTWTAQTSGSSQILNSVFFTNASQGWTVGINGTILVTSNGGTTWTTQTSGTGNSLNSIYFTSATQGWTVGSGGTILVTNNGGTTWTAQTSGTTNALYSVNFTSATQGWVVGNASTILVTGNGGTTWTTQTGPTATLNSVYFINANQGWVLGAAGKISVTINGGSTWTAQASGTTQFLNSIYFASSTQGWAVGNGGTILATSDGGTTWTAQTSGITSDLQEVYFSSSTQGCAVSNNGNILVTTNGGTTWTAQTFGNSKALQSVYFKSATQGWAVGFSGTILTSGNSGITWSAQTSGTTVDLQEVYFTSATQGWVVGGSGTILTTTNGGTTWAALTSGTTAVLNSVYFTSATQGWAVGGSGTILVTSDGGTTWIAQTSGTTQGINSIYFTSATQGWAAGDNGTILVTNNGGTTWAAQTSGTTRNLLSVNFVSATQGWAVGAFGTILVTIDGGTTWSAQTSGSNQLLTSVCFISVTQGWLAGSGGTILTTTNGGTTWTPQTSGSFSVLQFVNMISATEGCAVGGTGTILIYGAVAPVNSIPTVSTSKALSIATTSATLGGNVTADGGATVTERGVVYATTINPTTGNTKVQIGTGVGAFSQNITGLTASTLYHMRAYAINSVGTNYGADSSFTTLAASSSPTITSFIPSAGDVGSTVTIKGSNFKNVTKVWFGPAPAASFTTINDSTITAVVPDNAYLGNIAVATLFGYTIGTNYFMVKNPQNVIIGNNDQTSSYYLKNGKLYGLNSYNYDNGYQYRNCPVEMPSKGSLRGKTISQISNSGIHFIALASDNSVHTWGFNSKGQLGDSSSFASARGATVDITNKGGIKDKKVIQVLAGSYTSYALTSDGQVFSWGQDTLGALGNGAATNGVVRVPTSISGYGSLVGKTIIKLCKTTHASDYSNIFAIASDGTVHAWGSNQTSNLGIGNNNVVEEPVIINQTGVLAGKTIVEIDVSFSSTLLIDKDGLLYGMGYTGALGLPGLTQATPIELDMASGSSLYQKRALTILASKRLSSGHVLDTAGALHSFGLNTFGNLGDGTFDFKTRPVLVNATNSSITGKRIVGIANGDYCTYLLASDNTMHAFGSANNYALMNGLNTPNASKAIPIKTLLPPLLDATNINIKSITQNSATISCTKGSGMGRLIVLKALNSIDTIALANGISYTAAAVQPGGSLIDTTGNVIYLGNGDSVSVSGLMSNTLYHIAIFEFDTFSSPCSYHVFKLGSPLAGSFITLEGLQLPIVNTSSPLAITLNSAILGGNVISIGSATVTERGVVLATAANPTTANTKITIGNGLGNFSQNITALTPSTTYHLRAFAINSFGTSYGADSLFTTLPNSAFNKNIVNAFSPDGDGTNDTWVIDNADILNGHEINVYNIFGQLVFTQNGYNIPWDGKKDGDLVPSGEYYYQIKGDKVNIKGALLIKTHQ